MKKGLVALMIIGVASIVSAQWNTVYLEDFEASNGGYTHGGYRDEWQWGSVSGWPYGAHSGNRCWGTDLDGNYSNQNYNYNYLYSVAIPVGGGTGIRIRFWQARYIEGYWDHCYLYISPDGSSWTQIAHWSSYGGYGWHQYTYEIPDPEPYLNSGNVYIRWGLRTDYSVTYRGWYIDDVEVQTSNIIWETVYEEDFEPCGGGYTHGGSRDEWQCGDPSRWPYDAHSRPNCWGTDLRGYYEDYCDQYLYSPAISIPPGEEARLRFWHALDLYYRCYFYAHISPDGSSWQQIYYRRYYVYNEGWRRFQMTLPASYLGGTLYLRWRLRNTYRYNDYGAYIDDVSVLVGSAAETPPEIEVAKIEQPPEFLTSNLTYTPMATVKNNGGKEATGVVVKCSIATEGSKIYENEQAVDIPKFSGVPVTFDDWLCQGYCGQDFLVTVWTDFDDEDMDNNWKDKSCMVTQIRVAFYDFEEDDNGFTSGVYRPGSWVNDWEYGQPTAGPNGGYESDKCWATKIGGNYSCLSSSRLLSPVITVDPTWKNVTLKFWQWYSTERKYDGGNVKMKKDLGTFDLIYPQGGYPYDETGDASSVNGIGNQAGFSGSATSWRQIEFRDVPLNALSTSTRSANEVQFAWDFGSDLLYCDWYGWAIDDVEVLIKDPPIAIIGMNIPARVGINCSYGPTVTIRNNYQGKEALGPVDVLRRIGRLEEPPVPFEYEGYHQLEMLARDAEQTVALGGTWTAPPEPGIVFFDSIFAGIGGNYLDTVVRTIITDVDLGDHTPEEPLDTISINTTYYPVVFLNLALGCDAPVTCTLQLRNDEGSVSYISTHGVVMTNPGGQMIFDSVSVTDPGYYVFTLVARTPHDIMRDDTCKWDVWAKSPEGAYDVGPNAINMPDKAQPGDSLFPRATVHNFGQETVSFEVECKIEPGDYVETQYVDNLATGDDRDVEYSLWVPPDPGEYTVTVTTKLAIDGNPDNDTKTHTINVVGIAEEPLPSKFELSCIRPNPFSITTEISYKLPHSSEVSLAIYDISGKLIKTLVTGTKDVGSYTAVWDGRDVSGKNVPAGIYFVKLLTPECKATRKVVLLTR